MAENVTAPVRLYAADPAAERASEGMPIDPVCRMAVSPELTAGVLFHAGREHHFCSLECVSRFARDPDSYVAA